MIAKHLTVSIAPNVCFTQINSDEIVVLHPLNEEFYHLNATAVLLWLALAEPKSIHELTEVLSKEYQGSPKFYENDVREWIDDNLTKGLIICDDTNTQSICGA